MSYRVVGAMIIGLWSVARVYFWRTSPAREVRQVDMPPLRRAFLYLVSASLIPIYLYYFTRLLDSFNLAAPGWLHWAGTAIVALSVGLFAWSHSALGSNWTVDVSMALTQTLVTVGPYRHVRHPMYSSLILMGVGLVPATTNLVASLPYLAVIVVLYLERVADEERLMTKEFGDAYRDYMATTGRILPRFPSRVR